MSHPQTQQTATTWRLIYVVYALKWREHEWIARATRHSEENHEGFAPRVSGSLLSSSSPSEKGIRARDWKLVSSTYQVVERSQKKLVAAKNDRNGITYREVRNLFTEQLKLRRRQYSEGGVLGGFKKKHVLITPIRCIRL
jgi:hypothetical protein